MKIRRKQRESRAHAVKWGLTVALAAFCLVGVAGVVGTVSMVTEWAQDLPTIDPNAFKYSEKTRVYASDKKTLLAEFYLRDQEAVTQDQVCDYVLKGTVATEDERFFDHSGIDFRALVRVAEKTIILRQKSAGGGSTITQQLVKQLYSGTASSLWERALQKPIEWVISLKIERYYTKEEIITMYLNHFDFLHNAVGIKTAAKTYFGKEPRDLDTCEAATLVGMCKNPSYFNPVRKNERCRERRNVVLGQMLKAGYLTETQYQAEQIRPLTLDFHRVDHKQGAGTYFRDYLRRMLMAKKPVRSNYASWQQQLFYEDSLAWETNPVYGWCNKNLNREGKPYNIYTDGLKIYTTLDSRMQRFAEEAVQKHVVGELQPAFNRELAKSKNRPYY